MHAYKSISATASHPGFLITAHPSVCVPAVLGALTVWIQNQKKEMYQSVFTEREKESIQGRESIKGTCIVGVMSRETLAHWKTCLRDFSTTFSG